MKKRRRTYTGTQKFILVCFFVIVIASVTLTGLLIHKSLTWMNAENDAASETEPVSSHENTLQVPEEEPVLPETEETAELPAEVIEETPKEPVRIPSNNGEEWNLLLINEWNKLPGDFSVELTELNNGHAIDERAYPDLQDMMDAARAEGLSPILCSSYRSDEKQQTLFDNQVSKYLAQGYTKSEAETEAAKWVAVPGTSEHQTGLAVDIVALDYQILDENQENTAEQKWLMENSYKYGFILRYPSEKSELTGIHYEPWHYRYVGKEAAKEIYEQGICLEEYLLN